MGIFDKIKDEAEKLMQGHQPDGAQATQDMRAAQDMVRPQGGPPDERPAQDQPGLLDQNLSQDSDTGQGHGHGW